MKRIKKIMSILLGFAAATASVGSLTASAYVYASNEVKFDLYTYSYTYAPDVISASGNVYINPNRTKIYGVSHAFNDVDNTGSCMWLSIPTGIANANSSEVFIWVGQTRNISLKSNWVSLNGGSCYVSCEASLNPYDKSKTFTGVLYAY